MNIQNFSSHYKRDYLRTSTLGSSPIKYSLFILSLILSFNVSAAVQKFTLDNITYQYSFDSDGSNEQLTVVDWDASIIDLVIPEGIEIPDDIETPQKLNTMISRGRKYKFITLFKPVHRVVPLTQSITFSGAITSFIYDFSILPNLRRVVLNPNTQAIPNNFLKGCKNVKSFEISTKIKEIGDNAFRGTGLEKISIPSSVEKIGSSCFSECENLTEVVFESNDNQICYPDLIIRNQFQKCTSLKSITIGATISRINLQDAFQGCNAVEELTIASGQDELFIEGSYSNRCAFDLSPLKKIIINRNYDSNFKAPYDPHKPSPYSNHPTLEEVEIGGKATKLNMEAFRSCPNLHKITFNGSLQSIDHTAFSDLPSLNQINLPDGIETISGHLFEGCENLVEIYIPESVTAIEDYAFRNCKSLPNITLHEGVETLGTWTFQGCTSFTEFTFPNSLKNPGTQTFSNCINLKKVTIGTGLDYLDAGIFSGSPILYDFIFLDGDEYWDSHHRVGNFGIFCAYPIKNLYLGRNHNIVTHYSTEQPFAGSETLTNVTLGNRITEIQPNAFHSCKNLSKITYSENLEKIGEFAFVGNKSLKKLEFPSSLKEIGQQAFEDCDSLTDIILPEHFERAHGRLASGSWSWYSGVINITSLNLTPPTIDDGVFGWKPYDNAIVYVPEQAIDLYKTTFPWSKFKNIRAIGTTGIEQILTDSSDDFIDYKETYEIYNLNGAKIGNSIDGLSSGMYFIRQGSIVKKIAIN